MAIHSPLYINQNGNSYTSIDKMLNVGQEIRNTKNSCIICIANHKCSMHKWDQYFPYAGIIISSSLIPCK